jgi:hypothetical protein
MPLNVRLRDYKLPRDIEIYVMGIPSQLVNLCDFIDRCSFPTTSCDSCIFTTTTSKDLAKELKEEGYTKERFTEKLELLQMLGG